MISQANGRHAEALLYFGRAATFDPNNASIYNSIGLMHEALGNREAAIENYQRSIELDRKCLAAFYNLGVLYKNSLDHELSAQYLKRRIELGSPSDPWTLKAQEMLEAVYDKSPHLKAERVKLAVANFEEEMARKRGWQKQIMEQRKASDFDMWYSRGRDALARREFKAAADLFREALAVDPDNDDAIHGLLRAEDQMAREEREARDRAARMANRENVISQSLEKISTVKLTK